MCVILVRIAKSVDSVVTFQTATGIPPLVPARASLALGVMVACYKTRVAPLKTVCGILAPSLVKFLLLPQPCLVNPWLRHHLQFPLAPLLMDAFVLLLTVLPQMVAPLLPMVVPWHAKMLQSVIVWHHKHVFNWVIANGRMELVSRARRNRPRPQEKALRV